MDEKSPILFMKCQQVLAPLFPRWCVFVRACVFFFLRLSAFVSFSRHRGLLVGGIKRFTWEDFRVALLRTPLFLFFPVSFFFFTLLDNNCRFSYNAFRWIVRSVDFFEA